MVKYLYDAVVLIFGNIVISIGLRQQHFNPLFLVLQIYNKLRAGEKLTVKHVTSVLEQKYRYVELSSILGLDSAYDQYRKVREPFMVCLHLWQMFYVF